MSTVSEIEEAIERLPLQERESLESRLFSRRFGPNAASDLERTELRASLDEAEKEIDDGHGLSAGELRESVRKWAGR